MFFEPAAHTMGLSSASSTESRSRLAALSRDLRALERGETPVGAVSSPAIRLRLVARAIDRRIAERRADEARRGLDALQERMQRIVTDARDARNRVPLSFEGERRSGIGVFWSPVPVVGFRAWVVKDLLYGVYGPWTEPFYRAGCIKAGGERFDPAVPHTDGSCGRPPCGIYATRDPDRLIREWRPRPAERAVAFGVVTMSGKVVEHTRGYRASHVRVAAIVVAWPDRYVRIERSDEVQLLFADPVSTLARIEACDPVRIEACEVDDLGSRVAGSLEFSRLVVEASHG